MIEPHSQASSFEFTANSLCLDFTNTLHDRAIEHPHELLNNYHDIVSWSQGAQLLTEDEAKRLLVESESHQEQATAVLHRAIEVREAMFRLFLALSEETAPRESDLAILNGALSEAMAQARVVHSQEGFSWDWADNENLLARPLWPVVRAAADLLTSAELRRVRVCAADDCSWLFLDTSKNRSRRWCDMETCGNRAKARKHYERKRNTDSKE
ncbi:MAG: ABATE domain-containing protein [Ktedonobacteraceae bacterium]